jgi:hypothetical protein
MRRLILAALAATALLATPASARDYWNGSGFSLDHNFHSPYDNLFRSYGGVGGRGYSGPSHGGTINVPSGYFETDRPGVEVPELQSERAAREDNERAIAKARAGQLECRPVVIYGDTVVVHRALGCR